VLGVVSRGTTVIVVMGALLGLTGFLRSDEWRGLLAIRRRRQAPVGPETVEMAGELVTTDIPADADIVEETRTPAAVSRSEARHS